MARELHGHKDQVPSADISPHGQFLATGSFDSKTKIWDPSSGEELMVFEGHKRGVFEVKFAPDGNTLATGSHDGSIRFWNLKTGREVGSVSFTNQIQHVAFSADGSCMAVVESGVGVHLLKAPFPSVPQFGTNILPPSMVGLANDLDSGDSPTLAASSTNQASQSPVIIRQPQDQVIALGGPARFEVQAKADEPGQRYQWFREAQLIPDATNTTWTIPNVHLSDAGSYSVAIANGEGWIRSRTANLVLKIIEDSSGIVLAYDEFDGTGGEGWIDEEPNPASKGFGQFSNATGNWKSRRFSQEPFTNVLWMALTMKMSAPADDYYFVVPGNTQGVQRDLQFFNTGFSNQKTNLGMHTWDVYSGFDQLDLQTFLYWFDSTSGRTEYAVWILAGNGGKSDLSLGQPLARSWVNQVTPGVNSYYRTFGADGQQRLLVDRIGVGTSAAAALGWTKEDK